MRKTPRCSAAISTTPRSVSANAVSGSPSTARMTRSKPLLSRRSAPTASNSPDDENVPPKAGMYTRDHMRRWAAAVAGPDAFVIVTPEYNHSVPAVLKNALDHLYAEWNDKAVGFVGYGVHGGTRAVEHLRAVSREPAMTDARNAVSFSVFDDFAEGAGLVAPPQQVDRAHAMLDELVDLGRRLRGIRDAGAAPGEARVRPGTPS